MNDVIVAGTITDQARVQVQVLCDDFNDFNKGLFVSCIGHMHEGFYSLLDLFKGPLPKRNREAQVEDCSSPIEEDLKNALLTGYPVLGFRNVQVCNFRVFKFPF